MRASSLIDVHHHVPELPTFLLDYPFETSRAVASLLRSGALERHTDVRSVITQAGGTVPYLAGRLALGQAPPRARTLTERLVGMPVGGAAVGAIADVVVDHNERRVGEALGRLYYDTALSTGRPTLRALDALAGPERVIFGSDYPYAPEPLIGRTTRGVAARWRGEELNRVTHRNALDLFPRLAGDPSEETNPNARPPDGAMAEGWPRRAVRVLARLSRHVHTARPRPHRLPVRSRRTVSGRRRPLRRREARDRSVRSRPVHRQLEAPSGQRAPLLPTGRRGKHGEGGVPLTGGSESPVGREIVESEGACAPERSVMVSEKIERTRVSFDSGGVKLVGYLHRPADAGGNIPGVVMGHGFSGTQDRLFYNAERFAEAGLAALTFDYRNFGESGGEPRQLVNVEEQLEDWRAAIRSARGLEGVDPERIALWGSSLGGGHAISVAAEVPRVAAVVAQIPFNGFPRRVEGRSTPDTLKLLWAMGVDAARGRLGLPPRYIPMVGAPGEVAVAATAQAHEHTATLSGETGDSLWRNEVAPRGLFGMMRYRPGEVAHRLTMPVLVSIAEDDRETPEETTRQIAERAPRGELRRYPGTHFDFYRDPVRQQVLADQIDFLRTHLKRKARGGWSSVARRSDATVARP